MLAAEDILLLCGAAAGSGKCMDDATPPLDCAARMKRQRVLASSSSNRSSSTQQLVSCSSDGAVPTAAAQAAAASPAAPSPAAAAVAAAAPQAGIIPWQASCLLDYVQRCLDALNALHPVTIFIQTETKAAELACAIFRRTFLQRSGHEQAVLLRERFLAQALLAASLWVAVKWEATRTTTPDSTIMCRITGIPAAVLRQQEKEILAALNWDLMDLAREVGAVAPPEPFDVFPCPAMLAPLPTCPPELAMPPRAAAAHQCMLSLRLVAAIAQSAAASGIAALASANRLAGGCAAVAVPVTAPACTAALW